MPNTKLTKEKLSVHFHYNKMVYLLIIILAAAVGNLAYTTTIYTAPNARRVDIELIGPYVDMNIDPEVTDRLLAAGKNWERERDAAQGIDTSAADYEPALQELEVLKLNYNAEDFTEDNYYASQKFMVSMAAQEGDIFVLSRSLMTQLAEENVLVPLDKYIESGFLDPGDRQLGSVTFDEVDDDGVMTGEQHIYALQADSLTGMISAMGYDPRDKYLVIMCYSKNQDTAAAVMREMMTMFEAEPSATEAAE